MKAGKVAVGVVLIVIELFTENFGFTSVTGPQGIGYNAFALVLYGAGIWLIYSGIKPVYQK